jgi:redox-sensitive bicupin YhaK (pirin superfamily)
MGGTWSTLDPFLFCVHHLDFFPAGNDELGPATGLVGRNMGQDFSGKDGWSMYHGEKVPGFPYHPHRGFETITVVEKGFADHSDSLGATGRFGEGDVQWMTAGKGVQHSEMFPLLNQEKENPLELFQIWLNLPRKSKFVEPDYKMLWAEDIPVLEQTDEAGHTSKIKLIAGSLNDTKAIKPPKNSWAAEEDNQLAVCLIHIPAKGKWTLPAAVDGLNRALYFYKGKEVLLDGEKVSHYNAIQLKPDASIEIEAGDEPVSLLLLQAKPINEPVAQHGPFVMNSQAEIVQAFNEYRQTEFGGWPWPEKEKVHSRDQKRFAKYPDGSVEQRT